MASVKKPWMGLNDVKEQELDVVARPLRDNGDGSYTPLLPAGYAGVTSGQAPLDPGYVEANRGSWANADNAYMSDEDWATTQANKQGWAVANDAYNAAVAAGNMKEAERQLAIRNGYHEANEDIRMNKYGYAGGVDGSEYNPTMVYVGDGSGVQGVHNMDGGDYGEFDYNNAGKYVSRWQSQIDALTGAILGRDPFSYDKNKDPLYQQYEESYTRGGQRGMQDTLAQVAARTGGMASSYAESAAQQTYNNYMAALADKVPELQQLAYSMYMDNIAMDRADLDMLMGLDSTDYGRWSDDRNFNYGAHRDSVADQQWADSFAYQQAQDALAQQNWERQFNYDADWAQKQWDYNVLQDQLARQDALNKLYAKGSGVEPDSILDTLYSFGTRAEAYDWLVRNGYNATQTENYLGFYDDHIDAQVKQQAQLGLTGDDGTGVEFKTVAAYMGWMKDNGVDPQEMAKLLEEAYQSKQITKNEYEALKRRYPAE